MKSAPTDDIPSDLMTPPGDLVSIKPDGDQAWRITIKAGHSPRARRIGALVAVVSLVLVIYSAAVATSPINPDTVSNPWADLAWGSLVLASFITGLIAVNKSRVFGATRQDLWAAPDTFRVWEGSVSATIPWKDIRSVRLLHRDRPHKTFHPSIGRPWVMSPSDGLVLDTPHGALRILSRWHDDVTEWVAGLIAERAQAPLQGASMSPPLAPKPYGLTSFNTRTNWMWSGGCVVVLSIAFAASMWPNHRDAQHAESWRKVAGQIQNVESVGDKYKYTRVTYRYVVEEETYNNDRYDFGFQLSSRHLELLRRFALEDGSVTVWHDPADPQRSVLKRRGGRLTHTLFWGGAAAVPIGLCVLLRGILMQPLPLGQHYRRSLFD